MLPQFKRQLKYTRRVKRLQEAKNPAAAKWLKRLQEIGAKVISNLRKE